MALLVNTLWPRYWRGSRLGDHSQSVQGTESRTAGVLGASGGAIGSSLELIHALPSVLHGATCPILLVIHSLGLLLALRRGHLAI